MLVRPLHYSLGVVIGLLGGPMLSAAEADPAAGNPTFANPDTPGLPAGKPAPDVVNVSDTVFLKQLAMGSRAEVELGKLAEQRSSIEGVDAFARDMVHDHGNANSKLAGLARSAKVELPAGLDPPHAAARAELSQLDGRDFDLKYIDGQIKDHQQAVQLLIYEITAGQHAGVRKFAADTLPTVMEHLEHARSLRAQLTSPEVTPPAAASR
jgi:putative membrane protein